MILSRRCSSSVEYQLPKLRRRVRFPSSALFKAWIIVLNGFLGFCILIDNKMILLTSLSHASIFEYLMLI